MEKQQTAVEWLVDQLQNQNGTYRGFGNIAITHQQLIQQAKEMEKEQIMETWKHGNMPTFLGRTLTAEEYYNETFK